MNRLQRMDRRIVPIAGLLLLLCATAARAQSLRGSTASLTRQNRQAHAHDFSYLEDPADVKRFVEAGLLVRIPGNEDYTLEKVSFPYARPAVKLFLEHFAPQYRKVCGAKLVVTSLVRPESRQPRNASDRSVHPTGMAVDLRRDNDPACRQWMRRALLLLEANGVIEATHERHPPHYHVAVFPDPYRRYAKGKGAAGINALLAGDGASVYLVRRGDSLWTIARHFGVTVGALKRANGLRSSRVLAGQVLRIPDGG
ncbi:MAG TPA: DUF5715 family protein [Longimicrobiales bacterium]